MGNILQVFGQFLKALIGIWHNFIKSLENLYAFGRIYIGINGPILKNNLAIWLHWFVRSIIEKPLIYLTI